jgi:hypothetical protein
VESNKQAQKMYEPHGVYAEGYQSWAYGSGFEAMLSAALNSSLGGDAEIASQNSFIRSVAFVNHLVAPSGLLYNFGNCTLSKASFQPEKYWFARTAGDMSLVSFDEQLLGKGEVTDVAKDVMEFVKANAGKASVKGADYDSQMLDASKVEALSKIPGKDQLRSMFLATLKEPAASLARVLKAKADKEGGDEAPAAEAPAAEAPAEA